MIVSGAETRVSGRPLLRVAWVVMALVPLLAIGVSAGAAGQAFGTGDVFVAVSNGQVQWHNPDGSLVTTLNDGSGGFTTGMGFDAAGNLYVTDFSGGGAHTNGATPNGPRVSGGKDVGAVSVFDNSGNLTGTFGSGFTNPESILFDKAGDAYVGNAGSDQILKFDSNGNQLNSYSVATESRGADWIDLAADQCTMFYTSEGVSVKRFDVCANAQLPDFATGLTGDNAYALRLLPTGGALVADTQQIVRLDADGNVIQTYDAEGEDGWFALNLDPNGTSFWSADFNTADVVKFDIATGDVQEQFNTGTGSGTVFGLTVFGEITVGGGGQADLAITKTDSPDPVLVGDLLTYVIHVTNAGPDDAANVKVTDTLPSTVTFDSASSGCSGTKTVTCSLGTIANGESATLIIRVVPNKKGKVTNQATVSSSTPDPVAANNAASATTTVNPAPAGGVQTGAGGTAGRSSGLPTAVVVALLLGTAALGVRRRARS